DRMLRGTVHDPTTRRMGGVAGQAGVFSTAHDVGLYAQALLDRLAGRPSTFPLTQATLELMTAPEQPGHTPADLTQIPAGTVVTYPSHKGHDVRAFGWDIDTAYSRPRGVVFPIGSFGHTGYTGTTLWMDPGSDTYVVLLTNAVHPRDKRGAISGLRGDVASAVARALSLYPERVTASAVPAPTGAHAATSAVQTGVDVLQSSNFAALREAAARHGGHLRLGLLTNQTGLDHAGRRTIDILHADAAKAVPGLELVRLFSPEHGIAGGKDSTDITNSTDAATGLPVRSLYGAHDADRRPRPPDLNDLDAVVVDLQDAGCRFYTYESVVGYFIEALAKTTPSVVGRKPELIILDRPALANGLTITGPVSDAGLESYTNFMPIAECHGMTLGELARFFNGEKHLDAPVAVVQMTGWQRAAFFDETGVPWVNPSPNLRTENAAILYPGFGFLELTNLSVGRGSTTPFEIFGAGIVPAKGDSPAQPAWFHAVAVAEYLNTRSIPGVRFEATTTPISDDPNHYPFHGQTIDAVRPIVTDRHTLNAAVMGIEILAALHKLYPQQFALAKAARLVTNADTMAALERGDDPHAIVAAWTPGLDEFRARRALYLLYP
ncbi:MAG TPA: exo-beta-N-acetylmuramidase NamZ domain-containing protein, partial [Granulicella sp.]